MAYLSPIGIPNPSAYFGWEINRDTPAWPASWTDITPSETAGYYYVDSTAVGATDSGNTYGYPGRARLTMPEGDMTGAKMIYVHAGTYSAAGGDRFEWRGVFSSEEPFWITGNPDVRPVFGGEKIHIGDGPTAGSNTDYIIFENFELNGTTPSILIEPRSNTDGITISHVLVRNVLKVGTQTASDISGIEIGISSNTGLPTNFLVSDIVIYNCTVRNIGARTAAEGGGSSTDVTGIYNGFNTNRVWVLDCNIYGIAADSIAGSHYSNYTTRTTTNYYIGRNTLGNVDDQGQNGENGIDLKAVMGAVISQNTLRGPFMRENGFAMILHYGADTNFHCKDIAVIFNRVSHCTGGIYSGSSGFDNAWFIGNLIYDIRRSYVADSPEGTNEPENGACFQAIGSTVGANSVQYFVDNTMYDYERGIILNPKVGDTFKLHGNIFSQRAAPSAYDGINSQAGYSEIEVTNGAESRVSLNYDLYHNTTDKFLWANVVRDLAYMQGTAGHEANAATGDPLFASAATGLFDLLETSPAIDASVEGPVGDSAYASFLALFNEAILVDFNDSPRPDGDAWDMGAMEFSSAVWLSGRGTFGGHSFGEIGFGGTGELQTIISGSASGSAASGGSASGLQLALGAATGTGAGGGSATATAVVTEGAAAGSGAGSGSATATLLVLAAASSTAASGSTTSALLLALGAGTGTGISGSTVTGLAIISSAAAGSGAGAGTATGEVVAPLVFGAASGTGVASSAVEAENLPFISTGWWITVAAQGNYAFDVNPRRISTTDIGLDGFIGGGSRFVGCSATELDLHIIKIRSYRRGAAPRNTEPLLTIETSDRALTITLEDIYQLREAFYRRYGLDKPVVYS